MTLKSDDHFEVFLISNFRGSDYLVVAMSVDANRLFHENVFALLDRIFKVNRAKAGRGCDTYDIYLIDDLLVSIEACILTARRNIELSRFPHLFQLCLNHGETGTARACSVDFVGKGIRNGNNLRSVMGVQILNDGTGISAPASDHSDFDLITACDLSTKFDRERGGCGNGSCRGEKIPSGMRFVLARGVSH